VLEIEQQYSSLRRPIYKQRSQLLKDVPLFWARTIMNHPAFADRLTTDDEAILAFLKEVRLRARWWHGGRRPHGSEHACSIAP
jgi:template-activating factor I